MSFMLVTNLGEYLKACKAFFSKYNALAMTFADYDVIVTTSSSCKCVRDSIVCDNFDRYSYTDVVLLSVYSLIIYNSY